MRRVALWQPETLSTASRDSKGPKTVNFVNARFRLYGECVYSAWKQQLSMQTLPAFCSHIDEPRHREPHMATPPPLSLSHHLWLSLGSPTYSDVSRSCEDVGRMVELQEVTTNGFCASPPLSGCSLRCFLCPHTAFGFPCSWVILLPNILERSCIVHMHDKSPMTLMTVTVLRHAVVWLKTRARVDRYSLLFVAP